MNVLVFLLRPQRERLFLTWFLDGGLQYKLWINAKQEEGKYVKFIYEVQLTNPALTKNLIHKTQKEGNLRSWKTSTFAEWQHCVSLASLHNAQKSWKITTTKIFAGGQTDHYCDYHICWFLVATAGETFSENVNFPFPFPCSIFHF